MQRTLRVLCVTALLCLLSTSRLVAEEPTDQVVSGTVLDPSGAAIPHASVHLHSNNADRDATADDLGHFTLNAPAATYDVTVEAQGFRTYNRPGMVIAAAHPATLNVKLAIATSAEEVDVTADTEMSTDASANKTAIVISGDKLDTLSDDPNIMQQQLLAIGGSVDPTNPPQLYIDGFSGGQMPPKETIREIRLNQNPFSSQYEQFGSNRIEIFTKPGTNKLHGNVDAYFSNSATNARNPFARGVQPSYATNFLYASLNGPIGKKSSFFGSMRRRDSQSNAIVDGFTIANSKQVEFSQAVPNPGLNQNYSLRLDRQLTPNDTFIGRYTFTDQSQVNAGVGQFILPSEGYYTDTRSHTIQLSDSHLFGSKIVSDSAFQYIRTHQLQNPNSTAPTLFIQGGLSDGGSPSQRLDDTQNRFEFQEYLSIAHGSHFIRTGVRYRFLREANLNTAGSNGQFTFNSLDDYQKGTPSFFSLSAGNFSANLFSGDIGIYAEDDWKVNSKLSLNYGIRFESQSAIPDHFDPAPRFGFAYSIQPKKAKDPVLVVRGGVGVFFQRFATPGLLQSIVQNGVSQKVYNVTNPTFYPNVPPSNSSLLASLPTTPYQVNPNLHSPEQLQGNISIEHSFGKYGTMGLNYYQRRSIHQFESRNINAPLPGTGVRPIAGASDIYQYSSDGIGNGHTLALNANLNLTSKVNAFLFANVGHQETDTNGISSFVSNSYDVRADSGAISGYSPRQIYTGINAKPGWDTTFNLFLAARSSTYFNITTGMDNNGDSQYNDRPAFATAPTASSMIRVTPFGTFDANPQPGEAIIPINYGHAPAMAYLELSANKTVRFGPRPTDSAPPAMATASGSAKPPAPALPRYSMQFGLEVDNVVNVVNAAPPIGVLSSPNFGKSIALNGQFTGNAAANRTIFFHTSFSF